MKKPVIGLIILLTFIVQLTVKAQYANELKLKKTKSGSLVLKKSSDDLPKQPALAGILSFIVPGLGLGQLYNEQPVKMFIHTSITAACVVIVLLSGPNANIAEPAPGNGPIIIALSLFSVNWIWSVVDAVISANNINREAEKRKSRSEVVNKLKFGFTINKNKQLNLKFAFDL